MIVCYDYFFYVCKEGNFLNKRILVFVLSFVLSNYIVYININVVGFFC